MYSLYLSFYLWDSWIKTKHTSEEVWFSKQSFCFPPSLQNTLNFNSQPWLCKNKDTNNTKHFLYPCTLEPGPFLFWNSILNLTQNCTECQTKYWYQEIEKIIISSLTLYILWLFTLYVCVCVLCRGERERVFRGSCERTCLILLSQWETGKVWGCRRLVKTKYTQTHSEDGQNSLFVLYEITWNRTVMGIHK
jgi:hypothetical protein